MPKFLSNIDNAGKVSITDTGNNFTSDNVEGALAELVGITAPVTSVNTKTGAVVLTAADVSALSNTTNTWINDSQGNPRMYLGASTETSNQFIFRASNAAGTFQVRDSANTTRFAINMANGEVTTGTVPWARLTSVPTSFTPAAHNQAWSTITTTPTTLSGYGITDAAPSSHVGATGTAHGVATASVNGFMSSTDKSKLDGIAAGAQVNVATNLGITAGTTAGPIVTSSTGTSATLPTASATASGVITTGAQTFAGDKTFDGTVNGATFNATSATNGGFRGISADTVSIPSFTWTGDLTTGMYRIGASDIGFAAGGVLRGRINANGFVGVGTSLTALNASNLTSGTVATARLGTGTASSSTYLRGDGTWVTPPDTNTTYTAGNGLGLSGTTFSLDTPGTLTAATSNGVTADSHTHSITTTTSGAASTIVATDVHGGISGSYFSGVTRRLNTVNNNLGAPTVAEMALFHGQFTNKFRFIAPILQEESSDGVAWVASNRLTSNQLKDLVRGEGEGTSANAIPSGTVGVYDAYRLTWNTSQTGYVFLNQLYIYCSTSGNTVTFTVEAKHNTNGWEVIATGTSSNGPGHIYIPHTSIPFSTSASQYGEIRILFETTRNNNTNSFVLHGIEWFGGFPAGRRNAESYDGDKNVTFPNGIIATGSITTPSINLNGTPITATAAEINILDGLTATTAELNHVDGVTSNIQTQLNARAASSHTHGNITNAGAIGTTANLMVRTTTSGVLTTLAAGTTAQYLRGDGTWGTPPDTVYTHPANHPPSIITQDASNRFVTDTEKSTWNAKQATLVSGTNIKTVNGSSILGSGDLVVGPSLLEVYPVGAIYLSTVATSPATLFGGTWAAIGAGTFLVAQGTGYTPGSTGGAATHTHSTPNHTHTIAAHAHTTPSHTHTVADHTHSIPSHTHSTPAHSHTLSQNGYAQVNVTGIGGSFVYLRGRSRPAWAPTERVTASSYVATTISQEWGADLAGSTDSGGAGTSGAWSGTSGGSGVITTSSNNGGNTGGTALTTDSTGASTTGSASSLPPYLAVYMWQRTA